MGSCSFNPHAQFPVHLAEWTVWLLRFEVSLTLSTVGRSGIELLILRLAIQRINHCATLSENVYKGADCKCKLSETYSRARVLFYPHISNFPTPISNPVFALLGLRLNRSNTALQAGKNSRWTLSDSVVSRVKMRATYQKVTEFCFVLLSFLEWF